MASGEAKVNFRKWKALGFKRVDAPGEASPSIAHALHFVENIDFLFTREKVNIMQKAVADDLSYIGFRSTDETILTEHVTSKAGYAPT